MDKEAKAKAEEESKAKAEAEGRAKTEKTVAVLVRHKTQYKNYRCAGLVLKQTAESLPVTEAQLEKLRGDPWVEVKE